MILICLKLTKHPLFLLFSLRFILYNIINVIKLYMRNMENLKKDHVCNG